MALDKVHSDLESIGYTVQSFIIPACAVGAQHRRDRVWIVAYSKSKRMWGVERNICETECRSGSALLQRINSASENVADTSNAGLQRGKQRRTPCEDAGAPRPASECCENVCNATSEGFPDWCGGSVGQPFPLTEFERPGGREIERDFCGVAHGVSRRVDRLKQLGNAVVPQVVEVIGRAILKAHIVYCRAPRGRVD